MLVIFKNWEKFNPKSSNTSSWFRLNSNLPSRPIWDELTHEQFRVFIYILCQANESDTRGRIHISAAHISRRCTVSEKDVIQTIKILKQFQIVETRTPRGLYADAEETLPTNERTNETNEEMLPISVKTEDRRECLFDFETLYQKFPRKIGKQRGLKICRTKIKTETAFKELDSAITNYAAYVQKNKVEQKYIKHFSTFMGDWEDWIEKESTGTKKPEKKQSSQMKEWLESIGITQKDQASGNG